MQLALILFCLAGSSTIQDKPTDMTASFDGSTVLSKWYQDEVGSPVRDYVLSHRMPNGRWVQHKLGGIGNEDWDADFVVSNGDVVFVAIGTQVGYRVPLVAKMNATNQVSHFVSGEEFSLLTAWIEDSGLAFFEGHAVFLCGVKDEYRLVVSDGVTMKSALRPEELEWIGTDGESLLYRLNVKGKISFRTSHQLPTVKGKSFDLHLNPEFQSTAIRSD